MFHFIFTGTEDPVPGVKGLFADQDETYALTLGDARALTSDKVRRLLAALRKLDAAKIQKRWADLKRRRGIEDGEEDQFFPESFATLASLCEEAVSKNQVLLWKWG